MKQLLVGVQLTAEDRSTLEYTDRLCGPLGAAAVRFVHVLPGVDLADAVIQRYPALQAAGHETLQTRLQKHVAEHLSAPGGYDVAHQVVEGTRETELVRRARATGADLVIVGRRTERPSIISERVARKAPCSVLVVPQGCEARFARILVPLDFSTHSAEALRRAVALASHAPGSPVVLCYHAYSVPLGYHKTGKSHEEFAEIMRENAEREYQERVATIDARGVELRPTFELRPRAADGIVEAARDAGADLIVMGARGRTPGAALLLGSVTERVIRRGHVPVLAIKHRDKALSFFDALFQV